MENGETGESGPSLHAFTWNVMRQPIKCAVCRKFMLSLNRQCLRCSDCGLSVHEACVDEAQSRAACSMDPSPKKKSREVGKPVTPIHAAQEPSEEGTASLPKLPPKPASLSSPPPPSSASETQAQETQDAQETQEAQRAQETHETQEQASVSTSTSPPPIVSEFLASVSAVATDSMEKLSNTSQSTDDESPENDKPAEKHDAKAESEEPEKSVHGDADDSKTVAADSQHVLESADEEDTEVDSDDSGDNAGFPVAKTQRRKRIGCLKVEVLDSKQIAKDGSRHFVDGELSRALGYSLALGATSYRSPRLDAIVRERAALRKEDNLKRLTSFPAAQQRISETPVWAPGEKYVFDVLDLAGDLEMVLYKTSGSMSLMNRRVLGQINIPVIDLLEGCEGWFEIFPRSKRFKKRRVRPAVPVIDKSGLDFPRMSLGYVKLRVRTQLCIKESSLWKLYIAQLHPLELKDSFRATYRSVKFKDSLESFTEIRRNAIRINIVRAYLYTHLVHGPCTLLDLVCSWDSPLLTLSSWLFAFLLIFVIPIWMYPLAMAISLILASRAYLEGQHLTMNWATVPRPAKKDLLRGRKVSQSAGDQTQRRSRWTSAAAAAATGSSSPKASSSTSPKRRTSTTKAFAAARTFFSSNSRSSRRSSASDLPTDDEEEEEEVGDEEIVTKFAGDNLKDAVHNNSAGDPAESDIAPDDIPNGSTSGSSHAAAVPHVSTTDDALPHANETGNSLEVDEETDVEDDDFAVQGESAAKPSSSVRELPSGHRFDRPEDGVFVRDDFAEDFFVWNHQISDPKRGLNLIERSTLAWRELRWVQELTCDIAEAGEKLSLTLSRANPYASTAVDILVICAGAIFSLVFYLRSYFPVIAQSALFGAYVLATSPPAIRSSLRPASGPANDARRQHLGAAGQTETKESASSEQLLLDWWDRLAALWARLATIDDVGHRFVSTMQRVRHEPELEAQLMSRPASRSSSTFSTERISRMLLSRKSPANAKSAASTVTRSSSSVSSSSLTEL